MKCENCGIMNLVDTQTCSCGYDLSTEQAVELMQDDALSHAEDQAVGGWLLLFCISLTIISPFVSVLGILTGYSQLKDAFSYYPALKTIAVVDIVLSAGVIIFSIYAGYSLWTKRHGAVNIAKTFLLTTLGYTFVTSLLAFTAGFPSSAHDALLVDVAGNAFRSLVYFSVWYSYLKVSKRVKKTYFDVDSNDLLNKYHLDDGEGSTFVDCPHCSAELELDDNEMTDMQFTCPECNKTGVIS